MFHGVLAPEVFCSSPGLFSHVVSFFSILEFFPPQWLVVCLFEVSPSKVFLNASTAPLPMAS